MKEAERKEKGYNGHREAGMNHTNSSSQFCLQAWCPCHKVIIPRVTTKEASQFMDQRQLEEGPNAQFLESYS